MLKKNTDFSGVASSLTALILIPQSSAADSVCGRLEKKVKVWISYRGVFPKNRKVPRSGPKADQTKEGKATREYTRELDWEDWSYGSSSRITASEERAYFYLLLEGAQSKCSRKAYSPPST